MKRPDSEAILSRLKPFQRRTVEHGFHRLFVASDSTARFLVADEVGLGKTLVARGIIARAIDHLWDDVDRIDVVYICSNGSIARANLPKLQVSTSDERSFALATRLTMLATQLAPQDGQPGLADSKLNFVSFTPGTSFNMGQSTGMSGEREVLFHLLQPYFNKRTPLMNLLQGGVRRVNNWRWRLKHDKVPLDPDIQARFDQAFRQRQEIQTELHEILDQWFFRYRKNWPEEAKWRRNQVIGRLRRLLAEVCVQALEPDLVILDEFQRFKSLLETREGHRDPAGELAQAMFASQTPEGNPVRTLLLSATPYKLYTADAEIERDDHYSDFLATTRFLLDDEDRVEELQQRLTRYGTALKRAASGDPDQVENAKDKVEDTLRSVMARTERIEASDNRDAMLKENKETVQLTVPDVQQYLAADALFRAVGDRDPMPFWKSAPYLLHFMHDYKVNDRIEETLELSPDKVAAVLRKHRRAFLQAKMLRRWNQLDPGNAKLRELVGDLLDKGLWQLLWIPPTIPYWPLKGPFEGKENSTKTLVFSAWNMVPEVVSAFLSYEAERRMTEGRLKSYRNPAKQQVPLLRLTKSVEGARSRHRLLLLLMPCLPLADAAHPLEAPAGSDRKAWVRSRVEDLLANPSLPDPQHGEVDDRWEWVAPLLLDPGLGDFFQAWKSSEDRPNPDLFNDYLEDFLELDPAKLGRRPTDLAKLLTEVALGSPAILAARTMRPARIPDDTRRSLAVHVADSFWKLFNRPAVITLLNKLAGDSPGTSREEGYYWRLVLRYCRQGNLQAVLDEQWHLTWEQLAWSEKEEPASIATECARNLAKVVQPVPSRVHAKFLRARREGSIERDDIRIRTAFALRFGDIRTEDQLISQDALRTAFNSPFRPFVLASTSIGQEGLDFHPWCHRLVHWNLPGNPVDLEQREGRVHRYKGHAIRRNVAADKGEEALALWDLEKDLWTRIFFLANEAARAAGKSDLIPHWIAPGNHRVERHVPMLPYTKEVEAFQRLKRQLAAYRVVFGQPRQEELVTLLDQANLDLSQLQSWAIDLAPPEARSDTAPTTKNALQDDRT